MGGVGFHHPRTTRITVGWGHLRVVVVDDHPLYRRGLVSLLESGGVAVVGVAEGVAEAMDVVRTTRPDAVLTDILYLTDGSGIALVRQVVAHDPRIRNVVLTVSHDSNGHAGRGSRRADGYLTKEQAPERPGARAGSGGLRRRGRDLAADGLPSVPRCGGDRRVAPPSRAARERLTPAQLEILQLIASGTRPPRSPSNSSCHPRRCAGTSRRSCGSWARGPRRGGGGPSRGRRGSGCASGSSGWVRARSAMLRIAHSDTIRP